MFFQIIHSFYIIIIDNVNPSTLYVGIQTKGKFACLVCGPKIKSRHSKSLIKEVFDEYRHFLSKNDRYRTTEKIYFQWEAGDCIKTMENDTSPLEDAIQ